MSSTHKALFVDENAKFLVRTDIGLPEPSENELLIEVHYSGVNPADVRHGTALGIKSTVLGYDFAGRVVRAPHQSKSNEGAIVAGYTPCSLLAQSNMARINVT